MRDDKALNVHQADCRVHRFGYKVMVQCPRCERWMLAFYTASRTDAETTARDLVARHKWDRARVSIRVEWTY